MDCGICGAGINGEYPGVGEFVDCYCCDAEGYGTYDSSGNYTVVWIEDEEDEDD